MVRIAKGSGHAVIEVQMLLEEHKRLAKMFKSAHKTCQSFSEPLLHPALCNALVSGQCDDDLQTVSVTPQGQ